MSPACHHTTPNTRLRALLHEAGWSAAQLLYALRVTAAESGTPVAYDRSAVAHWLRGTLPREPVSELLAEVFTRRLRRRVSPLDLGFQPKADTPPQGSGLVGVLNELERDVADVRHKLAEESASYRPYHVLVLPDTSWPAPADRLPPHPYARRVGRVQVEALAAVAMASAVHHDRYGGRAARTLLRTYLGRHAMDWLRAPSSDQVHRALLVEVSRITRVLARTYMDDQAHGTAQHYFHLARRLAEEAQDPVTRAQALRDLSAQATLLGHHSGAADLAEAAVHDARSASHSCRAYTLTQRALAHAHGGDALLAQSDFGQAEALVDSAPRPQEPGDGYAAASLYYQQAQIYRALGRRPRALTALRLSLRLRPACGHRTGLLTRLQIASLELDAGHAEVAQALCQEALTAHPGVSSGAADHDLKHLEARLAVLRRSRTAPARPAAPRVPTQDRRSTARPPSPGRTDR